MQAQFLSSPILAAWGTNEDRGEGRRRQTDNFLLQLQAAVMKRKACLQLGSEANG